MSLLPPPPSPTRCRSFVRSFVRSQHDARAPQSGPLPTERTRSFVCSFVRSQRSFVCSFVCSFVRCVTRRARTTSGPGIPPPTGRTHPLSGVMVWESSPRVAPPVPHQTTSRGLGIRSSRSPHLGALKYHVVVMSGGGGPLKMGGVPYALKLYPDVS